MLFSKAVGQSNRDLIAQLIFTHLFVRWNRRSKFSIAKKSDNRFYDVFLSNQKSVWLRSWFMWKPLYSYLTTANWKLKKKDLTLNHNTIIPSIIKCQMRKWKQILRTWSSSLRLWSLYRVSFESGANVQHMQAIDEAFMTNELFQFDELNNFYELDLSNKV